MPQFIWRPLGREIIALPTKFKFWRWTDEMAQSPDLWALVEHSEAPTISNGLQDLIICLQNHNYYSVPSIIITLFSPPIYMHIIDYIWHIYIYCMCIHTRTQMLLHAYNTDPSKYQRLIIYLHFTKFVQYTFIIDLLVFLYLKNDYMRDYIVRVNLQLASWTMCL